MKLSQAEFDAQNKVFLDRLFAGGEFEEIYASAPQEDINHTLAYDVDIVALIDEGIKLLMEDEFEQ